MALELLLAMPLVAEVRSLTILHTNDLHARVTALDRGRGGFAALAAVIRKQRAQCSDCVLLNAGDLVQGSPISTVFHGLPVFEIANLFGFDAATLGNHDFDYGWIEARKFIDTANYPIVSGNLVGGGGRLFTPKPYVILRVNGLRVAVIGAITEELRTLSTPRLMEEWHAVSVIEAARKDAAALHDRTDLVVLLGTSTRSKKTGF